MAINLVGSTWENGKMIIQFAINEDKVNIESALTQITTALNNISSLTARVVALETITGGTKVSIELTTTNINWILADNFYKTLTENLELFDTNLPVFPLTKEITLTIDGNYTLTVPKYWALTSGDYDTNKTNIYRVFCEDNATRTQKNIITITGHDGKATIAAAGGLTKILTFATSIAASIDAFITTNATAYLAEKIIISRVGDTLVFTSQYPGYGFTNPTITNVAGDLMGSVVNTTPNGTGVAQVETVTLINTDGKVVIATAGGLTKNALFNTSLEQTAHDFVTDNVTLYANQGITLTHDVADLIFTATVPGTAFAAPTKTAVAGDLAGTIAHSPVNQIAVAQVDTIEFVGVNGGAIITGTGGLMNPISTVGYDTMLEDFIVNQGPDYAAIDITVSKVEAVQQEDTITLTAGTTGTADLVITGLTTKTITFDTSLAHTCEEFVTSHSNYYIGVGFILDYLDNTIIFKANYAGVPFAHPIVNNASDDIVGSNVETTANVTNKLIFTADIAGEAFVSPIVTPDWGDLAGTVTPTQVNVPAVKQVETITLTGTDGEASVEAAGGLTKEVRWISDLNAAATKFVVDHAAAYAPGIVVTSSTNTIIMTAQTAGTGFTAPTITNVPWDMDASIAHTMGNTPKVKQVDTVTLDTGTYGKIVITAAGGLTKEGEFTVSYANTAAAFVSAHSAAYAAQNIVLSVLGDAIVFTAATAGTAFTTPSIANHPCTLAGTVANTVTNLEPKVFYSIEHES